MNGGYRRFCVAQAVSPEPVLAQMVALKEVLGYRVKTIERIGARAAFVRPFRSAYAM